MKLTLKDFWKYNNKKNLLIVDDVFPHPISGFRYQEIKSILEKIPNTLIYSTGDSLHWLGSESLEDLVKNYLKADKSKSNNFINLDQVYKKKYKLLYGIFLHNAFYHLVDMAERLKVPFIFTLYPGGMFAIDQDKNNEMLNKVFKSPYFYKVIVTQKITRDYLIKNNFCKPEDIIYIFGVVTPLNKIGLSVNKKKHFGFTKSSLDICFVAHKYTKFGEDKGYDVFIKVAKKFNELHKNVYFHVVGPYDNKVIDVKGLHNIKFYGTQKQDWFDGFYKDKDIVLSPNINNKIFKGSFDGFPTGSSTDAALRGVLMMVTDPLNLNDNHFKVNEEIVIVKHDVPNIVRSIEYLYNNPVILKNISQGGYNKVNKLYDYDHQIKPRIELLEKSIKNLE